jgi:hypothetical protein
MEELLHVDRLVLLGDTLELRHAPPFVAMSVARPFFEELAQVMADREVVIVPGNHDHSLVSPWLARRGEELERAALGIEQRLEPEQCSPMLGKLSRWAGAARMTIAFPGFWVRSDVYACHGHYLDCHLTIPTMERLAIAATGRVLGRSGESLHCVDDYQAVTAPVFAWIEALAANAPAGAVLNGNTNVRVWRALGGGGDSAGVDRHGPGASSNGARRLSPRMRRRALAGAFPLAVAALNRAGLGPLRAEISGPELRRAGLRAIGEVAERLNLGDHHLVFGHTHRAGPLPSDDADEWVGQGGARLSNCGCWTYSEAFLTPVPGESPYWPGSCVVVEDSGAPVLRRLLTDRTHAQLTRG